MPESPKEKIGCKLHKSNSINDISPETRVITHHPSASISLTHHLTSSNNPGPPHSQLGH